MSLVIQADPVPLRTDDHGTVRVAGTRVRLDTIATAFQLGDSPEVIHEQYPTVSLPDVYAVVSYYLRHRAEVDAYVEENRREAEALRREIESRSDVKDLRERLLARRAAKK